MKKKIVCINQSTGYLMIDIVNAFAPHYDEVVLLCGEVRVQDVELDPKVKRVKIGKTSRVSHVRRFFAWSYATVQIFFLLLFRYRKYEILYYSLPPTAYLCSLLLPNKFSLIMVDVYPDVLKMLNIGEKHIIYRMWARWNKKLFKKAHRVFTIGDLLANLMAEYAPRETIHVVPLWTGLLNVHPVPKLQNPFALQHNIQDKFIVQYSGNIGATHDIEEMIEMAKLLKGEKDIVFLIIGRGLKFPLVNRLIKEFELDNCIVLPFQPDDVIRYSIACADISYVLLEEKVADVSLPSKVYNIMAVGSSILSISPDGSQISSLIKGYDVGANFPKGQTKQMADYILRLKNSPALQQQYSANAVAAAKNHTSENAKKFVAISLNETIA